ncbi:MAG: hypothetical protein ABI685_12905 [Ferruginibacter sp.]
MKTLEELKTDRSTFSIGQAFSDGWKLVSKNLGYYILGGIVAVVIGAAVGIIPFVGGIANNLVLSPCLMAGAVYVTWRISKGMGWTDFGDMFKGFNFLQPIVISTLIQGAASMLIIVLFLLNYIDELIKLFNLAQGGDAYIHRQEMEDIIRQMFNPEFLGLLLLMFIALLIIGITWAFKTHFIVVYKMQAWPAMEMSRRITSHNLLPMIGFFLLMGLILIISAIPCGIGLLFSLPLMIGGTYSAFAQITHCDDPEEINKEMFDFIADEKVD